MERKKKTKFSEETNLLPPNITEAKHIIAMVKTRRLMRIAIFF
jgi:hypothetical protein